MGRSIMFILQLVIFPTICDTDMTLNKFKTLDIFNNALKVWHRYIRVFIYRYHHKNGSSYNICSIEFVQILEYFKNFKEILNAKTYACSRTSPLEVTLKTLSGKFIFKPKCLSYDYVNPIAVYHSVTYIFYLHTLLRLNLTFYIIDSQFARLVCVVQNTNITWAAETYEFTGQYSTFYFYPKFNNVLLLIASHQNNYSQSFLFNGSFTVIDQKMICNVPVHIIKPDFMYQINAKYILSLYFLKVRKLDQIAVILYLSDLDCIIYDGPGILSKALKCQRNQKCSTFQCVLHLLIQNFKKEKSYIKYYSVSFQYIASIMIDKDQELSMNLPNIKCLNSYCSLLIYALYGYQVNLTIVQINISELFDTKCTYSGLVYGEKLLNDYRQPYTLCENHDGNKISSRGFYSYNSSLIIVLYWYQSYKMITTSVNISQTKCKPVQIDICKYRSVCPFSRITIQCIVYLHYVTQYSAVNISLGISDFLSISQANGNCNVFIFSINTARKTVKKCSIGIRFDKSQVLSIQGIQSLHNVYDASFMRYLDIDDKTCNLSTSCEVPRMTNLVLNKTLIKVHPKFIIAEIFLITRSLTSWFQIIVKHSNTLKLMAYKNVLHDCTDICVTHGTVLPGNSTVLVLQISGYKRKFSTLQHVMLELDISYKLKECK